MPKIPPSTAPTITFECVPVDVDPLPTVATLEVVLPGAVMTVVVASLEDWKFVVEGAAVPPRMITVVNVVVSLVIDSVIM